MQLDLNKLGESFIQVQAKKEETEKSWKKNPISFVWTNLHADGDKPGNSGSNFMGSDMNDPMQR